MKRFLSIFLIVALLGVAVAIFSSCNLNGGTTDKTSTGPSETTVPPESTPSETTHEHQFTETITPASCTAEGYTTFTCNCGYSYVGAATPKLEHKYGDWEVVTAATCASTGVQQHKCINCERIESEIIAATGHDYTFTITPPTKTSPGYTTHVCSVCGESYTDSYTNATGSTGLKYRENSDKTLTIIGIGSCTDNELIIYSETADGRKVTAIADCAFEGNTTIESIHIPFSVAFIGDAAFAGCPNLVSFEVEPDNPYFKSEAGLLLNKKGDTIVCCPAGIKVEKFFISTAFTTIKADAFAGCSNIRMFEQTLPSDSSDDKCFVIENGVLYNSDKTTLLIYPAGKKDPSFTTPNTVTKINDYAFYGASYLENVCLTEATASSVGIRSVGNKSFYGCTNLNAIVIPDSVSFMGSYSFANCSKLSAFTFGAGLDEISEYCFKNCTALDSVSVPIGIDTIKVGAFYGCSGMKSIVLGSGGAENEMSGLDIIEANAFSLCTSLKKVYYKGTSDMWLGSGVSVDRSNLAGLTIFASLYFYSTTKPALSSSLAWHYVAGNVSTEY